MTDIEEELEKGGIYNKKVERIMCESKLEKK